MSLSTFEKERVETFNPLGNNEAQQTGPVIGASSHLANVEGEAQNAPSEPQVQA